MVPCAWVELAMSGDEPPALRRANRPEHMNYATPQIPKHISFICGWRQYSNILIVFPQRGLMLMWPNSLLHRCWIFDRRSTNFHSLRPPAWTMGTKRHLVRLPAPETCHRWIKIVF